MLINKVKSFINLIIETVEYCLYGLVRVIIAPFKAVSIYKDYVAMKQYHEDMGYVEINDSTHKHDNYQSQIDMLSSSIEDLAQGLSNRINRNHQEYMKSLEDQHSFNKAVNKDINNLNPITLNPDTVTERLDKLEEYHKPSGIETYLQSHPEVINIRIDNLNSKFEERVNNLEKHVNEGILKEIRDLGHIEADRLGMEVAVEEKESIRDEKYQWKREQELVEAKIKEQAIEDDIEW